jgi:putative endonuclease
MASPHRHNLRDGRRDLGDAGEEAVAAWYVARGYDVLDRNWRCSFGEIDVVCRKGGVVVICEVKTRRSTAFGHPFEAVTTPKQQRLRRLGARWLEEHRITRTTVRFDVAGVSGSTIEVVEGAF